MKKCGLWTDLAHTFQIFTIMVQLLVVIGLKSNLMVPFSYQVEQYIFLKVIESSGRCKTVLSWQSLFAKRKFLMKSQQLQQLGPMQNFTATQEVPLRAWSDIASWVAANQEVTCTRDQCVWGHPKLESSVSGKVVSSPPDCQAVSRSPFAPAGLRR